MIYTLGVPEITKSNAMVVRTEFTVENQSGLCNVTNTVRRFNCTNTIKMALMIPEYIGAPLCLGSLNENLLDFINGTFIAIGQTYYVT